ncbi:hypothetical protein F5X99DRAFT_374550 [Biscogniauxia marginata]|nr:hypothetical protein F5X99DRAFT_374550 [Biscogniauxia marginata]
MACPRQRVRGCFQEPFFVTLHPDIPIELLIEFGHHWFRPHPWLVVRSGWELHEHGNPRNIRRSASVTGTGMDGLESGHKYESSLNEALRRHIMWAPVAKEDGYFTPERV